jgi:hypothetical protein
MNEFILKSRIRGGSMSRLPQARSSSQKEVELFAGRLLTSPKLREEFMASPESTIRRYFSNPNLMVETLGRDRIPKLREIVREIHRREEREDIPYHEESDTCWINFAATVQTR